MKKFTLLIVVCIAAALTLSANAQPVTFTGDVETDFTHSQTRTVVDPGGVDVGMPTSFPPGTISGNDMKDVRLIYDPTTDILYVGINTYGIAGDVDGDGDPANTSATLVAAGGVDLPDFSSTESFCIFFDMDQDGTYDAIAGVAGNTDVTGFSVNQFSGSAALPSFAFGTPLPSNTGALFANPSSSQPDLEFTVLNFSTLPLSSGSDADPNTFAFNTFIGSLEDDGIGEDFLPGTLQMKLFDYGDAPDPTYPTLLSNNGARHVLFSDLHLGTTVDADADGQPHASSLGDDNDGSDDEDGVTFSSPLMQMDDNTIQITANGNGLVSAWMDFNQDGDWDDPGEKVLTNESITAGTNNVTITIPLITSEGEQRTIGVASRFRFSTQADLGYTGEAPDGEVEDYVVDVLIPVELSSFTASAQNGAVELSWTTQTESDNLGFRLYRSEGESGQWQMITQEIIPGAGNSESVNNYSFVDRTVEQGKTYYYRLADVSITGSERMHKPVKVTVGLPDAYVLEQNYPNPFNPETQISFSIKEAGHVMMKVFNTRGQLVAVLADQEYQAGTHQLTWNGRDGQGMQLPSGVYLYQLQVNGFEQTRKMLFAK